jgi:hypothetical protein
MLDFRSFKNTLNYTIFRTLLTIPLGKHVLEEHCKRLQASCCPGKAVPLGNDTAATALKEKHSHYET